jgi:hypothetical protein
MATAKPNRIRCSNCTGFGYWKPTHSGEQPVCSLGDNFNFRENRYEDDHALFCSKFEEKKACQLPWQSTLVHDNAG